MDQRRGFFGRAGALVASLGVHLVGLAILLTQVGAPAPEPPVPIEVSLVSVAPPPPPPPPLPPAPDPVPTPTPSRVPAPARQARAKPAPRSPRPAPSAPAAPRILASRDPGPATLSAGELAGAAVAGDGEGAGSGGGGGGGGGGGACDMAARVQAALRRDGMVKQALGAGGAPPTALHVWNGDWVRDPKEDGKGLAVVREAILWAVGFAPPACRAQAVRGLVVLSVETSAGRVRLALGAPSWRWSDLLSVR